MVTDISRIKKPDELSYIPLGPNKINIYQEHCACNAFTSNVRTIFYCLNSVSYTHNPVIDFFHCSNFNLFAVKMRFVNLFPISRIDKDEINHVSHDTSCHMKTPKPPLPGAHL